MASAGSLFNFLEKSWTAATTVRRVTDSPDKRRLLIRRVAHGALVLPFIGTLWVPFYDSLTPAIGGVPFFYWYQFAWIFVGAAINAAAYFATREEPSAASDRR